MFETDVAGLDTDATLAAVEANEHTYLAAEVHRLALAAHWADLHPGPATTDHDRLPGTERSVQLGGTGTPDVGDFSPAELGAALRTTAASAARLIADALDLRHRLPHCWAATRAGQAPAYQARHLARATRHLTIDQAAQVDTEIAPAVGHLPWGRLQTRLDAAIYRADPTGADAAAAKAAAERFVRLGRTTDHGLRLVIARATAGDATWFKATIDRLADILKTQGDPDPIDVRRSKALGILAQPAEALALLCAHQTDEWIAPHEPDPTTDDGVDNPEPDPVRPEPVEEPNPEPVEGRFDRFTARTLEQHRSLEIVPAPFDPARARPRAILYLHLSQDAVTAGHGVVRLEDHAPILLSRLKTVLGDRTQVIVSPVIDLTEAPPPVDGYEIPARMREQLILRQPADVFPYAPGGSRRADLDHTTPYRPADRGGPPGQTSIGNLGPLTRYHHRLKTHAGWQLRQPEPGTWLWRSPRHRIYLVNRHGTHPLGHGAYAQQIWYAANPPSDGAVDSPTEDRPTPERIRRGIEPILRDHISALTLAT